MLTESSTGAGTHEHSSFRTTCGRDVRVGRIALAGAGRDAWRISLDIGRSPGQDDASWAGLTPPEARRLAAFLLGQAAAAEREPGPGPASAAEGSPAAVPVAPGALPA
jgi:hypothetical protein